LHFIIEIDNFWFGLPLMVGAVLNLISGILRLKRKKANDNHKNIKDDQSKNI